MRMKPRLLTLLLPLLASPVFAVSLGDELILSRLGDPVEIEIEVLQWEDMDLDRVQISAATREEYEVFDLTWLPVLEDLRFNLVGPNLDGDVRVLVSSRDPVNEPFLELLLVLRWPGGSLRREYVLLFDPPGVPEPLTSSVPAPVPVVVSPVSEPATNVAPPVPVPLPPEPEVVQVEPEPRPIVVSVAPAEPVAESEPVVAPAVEVPPSEEAAPVMANATPEPAAPVIEAEPAAPAPAQAIEEEVPVATAAPPAEQQEDTLPDARTQVAIEVEQLTPQAPAPLPDTSRRTYQIRPGDSLWNIARQFRPAGAGENLYQMLLSIHDMNRGSFINGNISLLRANAVLQIPDADDINRIEPLTAEIEFERRWDQGTQRVEAAQRGEPIPLFDADEPAEQNPLEEAADILPPGEEAPNAGDDNDGLVMVAQPNVPQPLQVVTATDSSEAGVVAGGTEVAESAPVAVVVQTQIVSTETQAVTEPGGQQADAVPAVTTTVTTVQQTRAQLAADLEIEVAAMRTRRQTAEAIATQLNTSLQQAQAQRAASASLLGWDNLLLAGTSLLLLAGLIAGSVLSLKIAGELRLRLSASGSATVLERQAEPAWLTAAIARSNAVPERKEPHMPEMEVVELHVPLAETGAVSANPAAASQAAVPGIAHEPDSAELFARLNDLLADSDPKSGKNA